MAASSYYDARPAAPQPLKPMLLADSLSTHQGYGGAKYNDLLHVNNSQEALFQQDEILGYVQARDNKLKYRIRIIKLIARVIGLLLSITTLIPLAITLNKFFATKDVFITVDGKSRTAWNANTKLWPMYMYFALSTISTFLNLVILIAYCWGIRYANRASAVESVFTGVVIVGHVVIWAVGAALYRAGKDEQAHARDLWGWTCSLGARQIQDAFAKEINFGQYCNIQSSSFFSGLVQTGFGILTAIVYFLTIMRLRSKRKIKKRSMLVDQRYESSRRPRSRSVGF